MSYKSDLGKKNKGDNDEDSRNEKLKDHQDVPEHRSASHSKKLTFQYLQWLKPGEVKSGITACKSSNHKCYYYQ